MPRKSRKNVGLIGLGIIGARVAFNLRAAGFQVFVWSRTPKAAPNFLGSPSEVVSLCDVIQIFVSDSAALFSVIDAMAEGLTSSHVIVCSATVGPEATLEAARRVEARGARFVDAPFTGSRGAAEKGQLVYYVGGEEAAVKKAEPFLKASSKALIPCGPVGHAAVLKVATNMITCASTLALSEALALAERSGVSPAAFAAALENNACRSGTTDLKLPKMVAGDFEPHFSLKHMAKDMRIALEMARELGIELPFSQRGSTVLESGLEAGWGELDFAAVFKTYERPVEAPAELPAGERPPAEQLTLEAPAAPAAVTVEVIPAIDPAPAAAPEQSAAPASAPVEKSVETPAQAKSDAPAPVAPPAAPAVLEIVSEVLKDDKPAAQQSPAESKPDGEKAFESKPADPAPAAPAAAKSLPAEEAVKLEKKDEKPSDEAGGAKGAEGGGEKKLEGETLPAKKPFNRIRRFFSFSGGR